jgi:hypothetical protein
MVGAKLVIEWHGRRLGSIEIPLDYAKRIAADCPVEPDSFRCPKCGHGTPRDRIALHPAHQQDPPWNTGFEWVGSCPLCERARREAGHHG